LVDVCNKTNVDSWYPSELNAERYAYERFSRRVARTAGKQGVLPVDPEEEEEVEWNSDVDSADEWDPSEWGR